MAKIPDHIIDRIRDSVDIVEVVSRYISLKKQGKNFKANCPFHTEKTPSFTVSPEKQIFYCFGCGAGGNVFNFLMRYEKISFIEAINKLSEETGIEVPKFKESEQRVSEYERLYRANQFAAEQFYNHLKNNYKELQGYLEKRGIKEKTLDFFKVGYSPNEWDFLYNIILQEKMALGPFLQAGLILQSEKESSKKYDRFRNRIIFPIHNLSGRVVAFGGRTLSADPDSPKYLNSSESPIYLKSQILYGLYFSKEWIRKEDVVIFVEGYMDYIQLFQNDIKNVVATSGTALTEDHTKLIQRYTKNIILCYDADEAGINAALRGGQILFENDLDVRVLILPENEDPDSYVKKNGPSAFYALVESSEGYFNFKARNLEKSIGGDSISDKSRVVDELLTSIATHSDPVKQNFYVNVIAQRYGLQENTLMQEVIRKQKLISSRQRRYDQSREKSDSAAVKAKPLVGAWSAEKDILIILLKHFSDVKKLIFDIVEPLDFLNDDFQTIFLFIKENQNINSEELLHRILGLELDEYSISLITGDIFREIENPDRYLNDCIQKVKMMRYQKEIDQLHNELKLISPQDSKYNEVLQKVNEILSKIQNIRKIFTEK